jgi:hypothetical protein
MTKFDQYLAQESWFFAKSFLFGSLVLIYTVSTLIRALASPIWLLGPNESPIYYGKTELTLLILAIIFMFFTIVFAIKRLYAPLPFRMGVLTLICYFCQLTFTLTALLVFRAEQGFPPGYIYSQGSIACAISCALGIFALIFMAFDVYQIQALPKYPKMTVTDRKLIYFGLTTVLLLAGGGFLFGYLLKIQYFSAYNFCLVTLLTVGYAVEAPMTNVAKISMIIYSAFGLIMMGFFLIALRDSLVYQISKFAAKKLLACWLCFEMLFATQQSYLLPFLNSI